MKHASGFLKGATIEYGGDAQDNDDVVELFCIKMPSAGAYWFSVNLEFADNGNDYVMIIGDFGAIGRDSLTCRSFKADEITEIQRFIEEYLSRHDIPYFSSMFRNIRPLGFSYKDNWIIQGEGELYDLSDGKPRPIELNA